MSTATLIETEESPEPGSVPGSLSLLSSSLLFGPPAHFLLSLFTQCRRREVLRTSPCSWSLAFARARSRPSPHVFFRTLGRIDRANPAAPFPSTATIRRAPHRRAGLNPFSFPPALVLSPHRPERVEGRFCELRPEGALGSPRGPGPASAKRSGARAHDLRCESFQKPGEARAGPVARITPFQARRPDSLQVVWSPHPGRSPPSQRPGCSQQTVDHVCFLHPSSCDPPVK